MSFGASPSDIIIVVTFARRLYRLCKNAGIEYLEISREVRGMHTVLKHLKVQVENPDSVLNRDASVYGRELAPVIGDCDFTLRQLDQLLMKYGRLGDGTTGGAGRLWDKMRFGSAEMDQLGDIRMKLINHKTSITMFLETVQLDQSNRMSTTLDGQTEQLDIILDKVDNIAARMGQKSGSIMTTYGDDDKEVWKQFRRELVGEGFSSDVLQQHKDVLRAYIREMDQNGLLVDMPPNPVARQPSGVNTQTWLNTLSRPSSYGVAPPSFDSLHTTPEDTMTKEMVVSEENMKFPPSMKLERPKPESAPPSPEVDGEAAMQRPLSRIEPQPQDTGGNNTPTQREPPTVPKLVTSQSSPTFKSNLIIPEYLPHLTPPKSIITTLDVMSEGLVPSQNRRSPRIGDEDNRSLRTISPAVSPSTSPTSPRRPSFTDETVPKSSMRVSRNNLVPATANFGSSPSSQPGTSPGPSRSRPPVSPRSMPADASRSGGVSGLAPDYNGRPIPLDAKWTQIRRNLISTEILDQDKIRYETRRDFVAILGVLSLPEIEDLASRSYALRASRPRPTGQPPRQPPRPSRRRHSSSSSSENNLADTSSSEDEADSRRRYRGTEPYSIGPPNPTQNYTTQQPPHQSWSPVSSSIPRSTPVLQQPRHSSYTGPIPIPVPFPMPSRSPQQGTGWSQQQYQPPQMTPSLQFQQYQQSTYLAPPEEQRRRRSDPGKHSHSYGSKDSKGKDAKGDDRVQGKRRWGENITAAGIGGAAVSLLSVLSEAAEGL